MGYQLKMDNGYDLMEVISALQKDIRLGNEEQAFYWALELIPRYEGYLWRRLLVIVNDDIGIANPQLIVQIGELRRQFFLFRDEGKDGTCRLILGNAILLMARSPKTRISDHFQRAVTQRWMEDFRAGAMQPIPDYALDCHTRKGKNLGRDKAHWLEHGCKLENKADVYDPYEAVAVDHWLNGREDAPTWGKRFEKNGRNGKGGAEQPSLF